MRFGQKGKLKVRLRKKVGPDTQIFVFLRIAAVSFRRLDSRKACGRAEVGTGRGSWQGVRRGGDAGPQGRVLKKASRRAQWSGV